MSDTKGKGSAKYLNALGFIALIFAIIYVVPFASFPPKIPSLLTSSKELRPEQDTWENHDTWIKRYRHSCPAHKFTSVKEVSRIPHIMLIEGFLTPQEAAFLVKTAEPIFGDSLVLQKEGSVLDKSYRDSLTAYYELPNDPLHNDGHAVVRCIEERAAQFQGYIPVRNMENMQAVKYSENQQFRIHWDWLQPDDTDQTLAKSGNRVSSFFVYLVANCTGGTTRFSEVPRPLAPEWCGALKCRDEDGNETSSLEVNAAVGRAVFWYNLDPTGVPDRKTLHAGMPVLEGTKVGLNIWTRERSFRN